MRVFTIGGYGFDESSFLNELAHNDVDLFLDVRQRAGMRGSKYAFLNKSRLQESLTRLGKESGTSVNWLLLPRFGPCSSRMTFPAES